MNLPVKKLRENAVLPTRATVGSAGLDLYACLEQPLTLLPGQLYQVPTGIAVALPEGTVGLLCGRSGLGVKHGITLSNSVGVIDSDYRGELAAGLCNVGDKAYILQPGERFAQLLVVPILLPEPVAAKELPQTQRGEGGFGSTGQAG
ncbi:MULTISPECIES: dUTP diphosphatase [Caproicibacterium]|uniref:Deoxyuridine 5'-triphosphate nucleotidohydrolase n=1 Tax=Caproicibacterium argilliputei TaxID=3030016 RepID=A0AA97DB14_9FIRM|nr:dUTP diphosphatase [Caproicibacterium argilliputei]WOC32335.1 dUTP diphosphatase [Caproicibacterium argilliputei]